MKSIVKTNVWCRAIAASLLAACAAALPSAADTSADAVMFRKPKVQPTHSFLLDVAPVKETTEAPAPEVKKEEAKKEETKPAAPAKQAAPLPPPAAAPAPEKKEPEALKQAEPPPKPAPAQPKDEVKEAKPVVQVEKAAAPAPAADGKAKDQKATAKDAKKKEAKKKEQKAPARDAIITSERTDYDRKEGVVLFDRNVHVDDAQYQMHADRLFLFLEGTNELKRLVAIGHVAITNDDKRAYCARATFNKKLGRVVMYSSDEITAELREEGKKGSDVKGEKITFWLDSEQVEVENPVITMPGGIGGQGSVKKLIGK